MQSTIWAKSAKYFYEVRLFEGIAKVKPTENANFESAKYKVSKKKTKRPQNMYFRNYVFQIHSVEGNDQDSHSPPRLQGLLFTKKINKIS